MLRNVFGCLAQILAALQSCFRGKYIGVFVDHEKPNGSISSRKGHLISSIETCGVSATCPDRGITWLPIIALAHIWLKHKPNGQPILIVTCLP